MAALTSFGKSGRVLLVDDSLIALDSIGSKLREHGVDVVTTPSPTQALALATEGEQPFDLIILDVLMPEMDGHELTRRLRAHSRSASTPILLLTTLDSTDDRVAGLVAGADDFFTKAAPDAEMLARVRSFISLGKMRAQLLAQHEAMARVMQEPESVALQARVVVIHHHPGEGERLVGELRGSGAASEWRISRCAPPPRLTALDADVLVVSYPVALEGEQPLLRRHGFDEGAPSIVVLDEAESTERRVASFDAGADDYLTQETPAAELAARLTSALRRQHRQQQLRSSRDRAMLAAVTDPLTGLYNRAYFYEAFGVELRRAQRYQHPMTLVLLDLDHFKQVNDTLGHTAGDEALREVSSRLRKTARSTDIVARYGGEEFAMILPETDLERGLIAAERFRVAVEGATVHGPKGGSRSLTLSQGVACYPLHSTSMSELVELADAALYAAKRTGRNRVCTASQGGEPLPPAPSGGAAFPVLERLRRLISDDSESPLASVRMAARMLHEAATSKDALHSFSTQLRESSEQVRREVQQAVEELVLLLENRR